MFNVYGHLANHQAFKSLTSCMSLLVPEYKMKFQFANVWKKSSCLSSPDCEEWSECTVSEKFCRKFIWHHTGPVLQEETLSGKPLQTFSDSSPFHFPSINRRALTVILYYAWAFIILQKRESSAVGSVQTNFCCFADCAIFFFYQCKSAQESQYIRSSPSLSMKWWFSRAVLYWSCSTVTTDTDMLFP